MEPTPGKLTRSTRDTSRLVSRRRVFDSVADEVFSHIQTNYPKRTSLSHVARYLGVSRGHVSRIFKKQYGCTVMQMVTGVRIERAKELMSKRDGTSLKQVCFRVGYQSYDVFFRRFRKATGVAPTEF